MKDLTNKEFEHAPNIVKYIYGMSITKQPIGGSTLDKAIEEYPEYFPDEVNSMKKWAAIPQKVHDAYWKEYWKIDKELNKDTPHLGKGIMYYAEHPEEYVECSRAWKVAYEKGKPLKKELHEKFYAKYNIEYHEI